MRQPSIHEEHEDGNRIHDWVAQQYYVPEETVVKMPEHQQNLHSASRADSPLEDFSWSSSAASSTPALSTMLNRETEEAEADATQDFHALRAYRESLPPMTFKRGKSGDDCSTSSEEELRGVDKPLPLPPPPSPPAHSPSPSISQSVSSRSRRPSLVSLSGYHLPSSVQVPTSSTSSPKSSLVSLSRQSSFTGHTHPARQPSIGRQSSLPLLSPSASSTLFEEDDGISSRTLTSSEGSSSTDSGGRENPSYMKSKVERRRSGRPNCSDGISNVNGGNRPALVHARSDSMTDYTVSGHLRGGLSRSGSASGASVISTSSSSLRRQSSVNSIHNKRGRPITRLASTGNLLGQTQSNTIGSSPTTRRSTTNVRPPISSDNSSYGSSIHNDHPYVTTIHSTGSMHTSSHSISPSMSLSLLAPPPTATVSSSGIGASSGSATISTPRNRDAVYIDPIDSEEVQRRLAALLAASGTPDTIHTSSPEATKTEEEEHVQEIEYYFNEFGLSPSRGRSEETYRMEHLGAKATPGRQELSHWSPSSSNEDVRVTQSSTSTAGMANSKSLNNGLGLGSIPGLGLGLIGAPPSSKQKNVKAKKSKEDASGKKRKSIIGGIREKKESISSLDEVTANGPEDGSISKRPRQRQRLTSLIARAMGGNNFVNPASPPAFNPNSSAASVPLPTTSGMVPNPAGSSSTVSHANDSGVEHVKGHISVNSAISPILPSTESMVALPPSPAQRPRALSNTSRPSPLRVEFSSSSNFGGRQRAISVSTGPTPPLTPASGRMRSESEASQRSYVSRSSVVSSLSCTSSQASSHLGSVLDQFPSPGRGEDEVRSEKGLLPDVVEVDDLKSEGSEGEDDDGAYYVQSFERSYGNRLKLKSQCADKAHEDDGEVTETEATDVGYLTSPITPTAHTPATPSAFKSEMTPRLSRVYIPSSRPTSMSKSSPSAVPLPLSPPQSIMPSPVLPLQLTKLPSPSTDLLDSDPFACGPPSPTSVPTSPSTLSPSNISSPASYFHNHPSPFNPMSSNHPYPSRSLHASRSMGTLTKSGIAIEPKASAAKSLIGPGDLPPSKLMRAFDLNPPRSPLSSGTSSSSSQQTVVPSTPKRTTGFYVSKSSSTSPDSDSPTSPTQKRKSTRMRLRMSVTGLVSRLHIGGGGRGDSPTLIPLPTSPTQEEPMPSMLPTPVMTPTLPSAPTPPPLPSHQHQPTSASETDVDYDEEDDEDEEDITTSFSVSSPPTPSVYAEQAVTAPASKRKSLGLGLSEGSGGGGGSRLSLSSIASRKGKKRKLVVSGVAPDDEAAFEAVKDWCQTFGQIRQITRKPNGNLHVDFKSSSVAETVCRLQAQVYIKGAGSVALSWYTGKDKSKSTGVRV